MENISALHASKRGIDLFEPDVLIRICGPFSTTFADGSFLPLAQ